MEKFTPKERKGGRTHSQEFDQYRQKISELEFKMTLKILAGLEKKARRH